MTDSFYGASGTSPPEVRVTSTCPDCRGYGETAVPGTYGPTISPENLELIECSACSGVGEVTKAPCCDGTGWTGDHRAPCATHYEPLPWPWGGAA